MPALLKAAVTILLIAFFTACLPPPPTPVMPPGTPLCAAKAVLTPDSACLGMFTDNGSPCAVCGGVAGCYDKPTGVYCVSGTSCTGDRACAREAQTVAAASSPVGM